MRPLLLSLACLALTAQGDPFAPVRGLAGAWVGEGQGDPGKGSGGFAFTFELGGKVLLRRAWAAYPAQGGRPASRHEDLMTLFPEGGQLKALYVDNEGHVIHYRVAAEGDAIVFRSEAQPGPAFRLTYRPGRNGTLGVAFAMAPPEHPEAFTTYVEGVSRRQD